MRWLEFLDQWERALDTGLEVMVVGDCNINHCNWSDQNLSADNQTTRLGSLIQELFTRILSRGVYQLVQGPTRHWPNQPSTGIDHFFSNKPDRISSIDTRVWGGSDHMMVSAIRVSKSAISTPMYVRKRIYKSFHPSEFLEAISQIN